MLSNKEIICPSNLLDVAPQVYGAFVLGGAEKPRINNCLLFKTLIELVLYNAINQN